MRKAESVCFIETTVYSGLLVENSFNKKTSGGNLKRYFYFIEYHLVYLMVTI